MFYTSPDIEHNWTRPSSSFIGTTWNATDISSLGNAKISHNVNSNKSTHQQCLERTSNCITNNMEFVKSLTPSFAWLMSIQAKVLTNTVLRSIFGDLLSALFSPLLCCTLEPCDHNVYWIGHCLWFSMVASHSTVSSLHCLQGQKS